MKSAVLVFPGINRERDMARTLKLHVVAEGVENRVQQAFLRERGCDELQGFLFSKPLPAAEFAAFVHDQRQPTAA